MMIDNVIAYWCCICMYSWFLKIICFPILLRSSLDSSSKLHRSSLT